MEQCDHQRIMKFFFSCVLVVFGVFFITGTNEAIAKEFFVAASNGKDSNPGTKDAPFLTLKTGVGVLLPGDTLFVRTGTYLGSSSLSNIPNGTSWIAPVTIKTYQEENVVIIPEPGLTVLEFKPGNNYIIFDGFVFNATGGHAGIRTGEGSHHIRIMNSEIMNAPSQGILANKDSASFEFINLRVHHNGSTKLDHGFYITSSFHLVKNCRIYRNMGRGVQIYSGGGNSPSNNILISNEIYENGQSGNGVGIIIASGSGNQAINNVIWGETERGIQVDISATNTKIYNNTVYGAQKDGILIGSRATNTEVRNNISYNIGGEPFILLGTGTVHSNNLSINPQFFDADKRDFHLQPSSPAIKAGMTLSGVTTDFDGKERPKNAYDIGAFQSGNLLAPPMALRVLSY